MHTEPEIHRRRAYGENPEVGERARRTYARILRASVRVFERRGFQDARMSDVARTAHTARATVYQYFESKNDILLALSAKLGSELMALVQELEPLDGSQDGRKRLRAWLESVFGLIVSYSPVIDAWTDPSSSSDELEAMGTQWNRDFRRELGSRLAGPGSDLDGTAIAVTFYGCVESLALRYVAGDLPLPIERLLDELAIVAHLGMFPEADPPVR